MYVDERSSYEKRQLIPGCNAMFRLELENPFIKNQQTPVASSRIWKNGKRPVRLSQIQILVDVGYGEKPTIYTLFEKSYKPEIRNQKRESPQ